MRDADVVGIEVDGNAADSWSGDSSMPSHARDDDAASNMTHDPGVKSESKSETPPHPACHIPHATHICHAHVPHLACHITPVCLRLRSNSAEMLGACFCSFIGMSCTMGMLYSGGSP